MRAQSGGVVAAFVVAAMVGATPPAEPPRWLRESFEGKTPLWQKGPSDTLAQVLRHETTTKTAQAGQQSEYLYFACGQGTQVQYVFPIGQAALHAAFQASVWLQANRPGMQLAARVVLPKERRPDNLDQPITVLIRGETYTQTSRWQPLRLPQPDRLLKEQEQLLRAELKRDVNVDGAFVDQIVLNLYGGPGVHEVWIDSLDVGPLSAPPPAQARMTGPSAAPTAAGRGTRGLVVDLHQDRLAVNGKPFFLRGIRGAEVSAKFIRDAGFNAVWVDVQAPEKTLAAYVQEGLYLVPEIPLAGRSSPVSSGQLTRWVNSFAFPESVLAWGLGSTLAQEQLEPVQRTARDIQQADPLADRPLTGAVWDGFRQYGRVLRMLGVHRWPLFTGLELRQHREWLVQRGRLADPGTFLWTWIQTHAPEWQLRLGYEKLGDGEVVGPQPSQLRLLTYLALSAGCRGLAFWTDPTLADPSLGKTRRLELQLLNQELQLLEPLLAGTREVDWLPTRHPDVMAAVLRWEGGALVLPLWLGAGGQFVVDQAAIRQLDLIVPSAPWDAQAWLVTPAGIKPVAKQRVAGGLRLVLPEFDVTAAILITADLGLIGKLQQQTQQRARRAAEWAYELAREEYAEVTRIDAELTSLGQGRPDARNLLNRADQHLKQAQVSWTRGNPTDFADAFAEAQRARRPLRLLMRKHWLHAVSGLDTPTASPHAVSFATLPRHWKMLEEIRRLQLSPNLLRYGDCEPPVEHRLTDWTITQVTLDDVLLAQGRVTDQPHGGRQCWKLQIQPRDPAAVPAALERTFLAVTTPAVAVPAGALVRIAGWLRTEQPLSASVDGLLLYDSIGGEPLGVRLQHAPTWRKFQLYRRVPADGRVSVTVALTGLGTAYFDDLEIEALTPPESPVTPAP